MYNADPANLSRPVPKVMRDAAEIVRRHGAHLGDSQDHLVARLEAPYTPADPARCSRRGERPPLTDTPEG